MVNRSFRNSRFAIVNGWVAFVLWMHPATMLAQITIVAPQPEAATFAHPRDPHSPVRPAESQGDSHPADLPFERRLPNWDPRWNQEELSGVRLHEASLLTDEDCGCPPTAVDLEFGRHVTHSWPHPMMDRRTGPSRDRQFANEGRLHQAYKASYRSQMPSLKKMHPSDQRPEPGERAQEPDLFGATKRQELAPPIGSRGQWFARYETLVAWPYYSNGHSGLTVQSGALALSEPFDYNLLFGHRGVVGWESKKGPGGIFQYTDLFAVSERLSAAAVGGVSGVEASVVVPSPLAPFSIAAAPGERLEATAREHLTSYRPTAFKRVYFPISTITGGFGFDYTVLRQSVHYRQFSNLATTAPSNSLDGLRRFSGIGPSFDIEYHRPIGHTQLAMLGGAQMGVLFGSDRWNVLEDGMLTYQENSHRTITNANVRIGVEWSQAIGARPDSRVFARFTIEGQNWLNAGNLSDSNSALGFLSGNFSFGAAY
ncbi:MAG: hypothetical protein JNL67_22325 [Planctomycetaceae bacterium]|nr:hypothetical protein [Planctomycetaceae bacterium]